jgi:hypothetical protein
MSRTDNTRLACEDGNVERRCGKAEKERKDQMGWDVEENGAERGEERRRNHQQLGRGREEEERKRDLIVYGVST